MQRYAVFGHPIAHSRSPFIHAEFASQLGIALRYDAIDAEPGQFPAALAAFGSADGRGANVTLPLKELAVTLCAELSERARGAGAVNTLIPIAAGWRGDNTDGVGLLADLDRLGIALRDRRVLLLGAGGAARGVLGPLLEREPRQLVIANRTPARAQTLRAQFDRSRPLLALGLDEIGTQAPFDVLIHASAAGHGAGLCLQAAWFARESSYYDLSYGKAAAPMLQAALVAGARRAEDGLGMLVEQAAEAFALWHGMRPRTEAVLATLRKEIG